MRRRLLSTTILALTVFCSLQSFGQNSEDSEVDDPNALVEVRHSPYVYSAGDSSIVTLTPYLERRTNFGFYLGLGFSQYAPKFVSDQQTTQGQSNQYTESSGTSLTELSLSPKWNFPLGSIALDLGGGYYEKPALSGAPNGITVSMYRAGLTLTLDALGSEPLVAPYFSGGVYEMNYNETLASGSSTATTAVAPYVGGGLLIQLNWIERDTSMTLYNDSGIENTFLYVEARDYLRGSTDDPDFSDQMAFGAGLKVEF